MNQRIFHRNRVLAALAAVGVILAGLSLAPLPARADDPSLLTVGAGAFDFSGDDGAAIASAEYTDRSRLWIFHPMAGLHATSDGAFYAYAGVALDLFFGRRVVLTPSFAPGLYLEGGGKDLGHVIEFRSAVRLAWRFDDRSRLGLDLSHLSNAGLDDRNPGANQLMLTYSLPLGR